MPSGAVRAVLDTNVAVSALLFGGVLNRKKFARRFEKNRPVTPAFLLRRYTLLATRVALGPIERTVPTDVDDDVVIATAIAAGATLIVSGDSDLLALHPFRNVPILAPAAAIASLPRNTDSQVR